MATTSKYIDESESFAQFFCVWEFARIISHACATSTCFVIYNIFIGSNHHFTRTIIFRCICLHSLGIHHSNKFLPFLFLVTCMCVCVCVDVLPFVFYIFLQIFIFDIFSLVTLFGETIKRNKSFSSIWYVIFHILFSFSVMAKSVSGDFQRRYDDKIRIRQDDSEANYCGHNDHRPPNERLKYVFFYVLCFFKKIFIFNSL